MKIFLVGILSLLFTSCYTMEQGYEQIKLLTKRQPISEVIEKNGDVKERLEKLKLVQPVLDYAEKDIGLSVGSSYQSYVKLDSEYLTWIVQAAEKRSLKLKTWWFPIVGDQPYLGFFHKEKALAQKKELDDENYDTVMRGVSAFSLLGYFSDPIYSSMLDHTSLAILIETLIHENVHRTIYVKNQYAFNENLANFIARQATEKFLRLHSEIGQSPETYQANYEKNNIADKKFQEYLLIARKELKEFYLQASKDPALKSDSEFLKKRAEKFDELSQQYKTFMNGSEVGTYYERAFNKGKINNALIISYSIYSANQKPFEIALKNANGDIKQLVANLKKCFENDTPKDENALWNFVEKCGS